MIVGLFLLRSQMVSLAACCRTSCIWFHWFSIFFSWIVVSGRLSSSCSLVAVFDQYSFRYLVSVNAMDWRVSSNLLMKVDDGKFGILGALLVIRPLGGLLIIIVVCKSLVWLFDFCMFLVSLVAALKNIWSELSSYLTVWWLCSVYFGFRVMVEHLC